MDKERAIELIEMVERGTLEHNSSLAKEAYRYLRKLKSTSKDMLDRIYWLEYSKGGKW